MEIVGIIVTAALMWCVFAGLDALFRKKPRPMSGSEMEEMIVKDAAASLGVSVAAFREMLLDEMEGKGRPRPKLRVVK